MPINNEDKTVMGSLALTGMLACALYYYTGDTAPILFWVAVVIVFMLASFIVIVLGATKKMKSELAKSFVITLVLVGIFIVIDTLLRR